MLTRIYGTAFDKKADLDEYLAKLEEAKKRDHNKLGRELGIFMTDENIGQGLPLIMPKGARIIQIMQRFVEDEEQRRGYLLTKTPIMSKNNLFITSGHWDHYKDKMFYIGEEDVDDEILCLRPMTCPFQFTIYKNGLKSYRDLPIRYAETAIEFRKEASGEMHGLTRIRQFTLADGHIVCTPDQLEDEFAGAVDLIKFMLKTFDLEGDVTYRFSRWDPANADKYVGDAADWERSEGAMKTILDDLGIEYTEAWGEAAFYGPKLDVQGTNVHGKEDTLFTVQLDFALAERFDMMYIDENGEKARPLIIHRSSIGCYERTLAMLIEKYNGAIPHVARAGAGESAFAHRPHRGTRQRASQKSLRRRDCVPKRMSAAKSSARRSGKRSLRKCRMCSSSATRRRKKGWCPCATARRATSAR